MVQRKELGRKVHDIFKPETVLALRRLHEAQGMRTIWDSQMGQRIIVEHDEEGNLARIMAHKHDGERGAEITPWWWETACCPMLEPDDVLENMNQSHPLRVEYTAGGSPRYMWLPWLCNPLDNDDSSRLSDGNAPSRRCVGDPPAEVPAPPEQENMWGHETVHEGIGQWMNYISRKLCRPFG